MSKTIVFFIKITSLYKWCAIYLWLYYSTSLLICQDFFWNFLNYFNYFREENKCENKGVAIDNSKDDLLFWWNSVIVIFLFHKKLPLLFSVFVFSFDYIISHSFSIVNSFWKIFLLIFCERERIFFFPLPIQLILFDHSVMTN